jgi:hypothetical protein
MAMSRETKFGYGFWFAGIGVPYLIDKLVSQTAAFWCAVIFTAIGAILLFAGHQHRDAGDRPLSGGKKIGSYSVLVIMLAVLIFGIVKFRPSTDRLQGEKTPSVPEKTPPDSKPAPKQEPRPPEVLLVYQDQKINIYNPGPHTLYLYGGALGNAKVKVEKEPPRVIVPGAYYYLFTDNLEERIRSRLRDGQTGRDTFHAFVTTEESKKYTVRGILMVKMQDGVLTINTQIIPTIMGWSDLPI